jgi:hypothetical protein
MTTNYCTMCGNNQVPQLGNVCNDCTTALESMPLARRAWHLLHENHRRCCGHLSWARDHLFFHAKDWDGTHEDTWCEYGVNLHPDGAVAYWIFDNDSVTDSFQYDNMLPYPKDESDAAWQAWHDALMSLLERAPEVAWSSDVLSCEACGNHYHVAHGCCESDEGDESDAMEEGVDNVPPVA